MPAVNEILEGHVVLDLECLDRIYLNAYVPTLQVGVQVVTFFSQHRNQPIASPALIQRMAEAFRQAVATFAKRHHIPVLRFAKHDRQIDLIQPYFRAATQPGVIATSRIGRVSSSRTPGRARRRTARSRSCAADAHVSFMGRIVWHTRRPGYAAAPRGRPFALLALGDEPPTRHVALLAGLRCITNLVQWRDNFDAMRPPVSADVSDTPLFNTAAVVQRTGVPAVTFRAWERRYGSPKPRRTSGGQRLYSDRDIQAIRWLSEQTAHGVAISRAVEMLRLGYAQPRPSRPARSDDGRTFEALQAELGEALLVVDSDRAESVLAEAFALFSVEDVCLQVLQPMLIDIGERWHAGEVSVAEEHYASSFVRGRVFGLLHAYQTPDGAGPLVFTACASDEWHELGVLLVSVFLARRGAAVRYLGPNLPLDALAAIVARHHPAAVVLSAQSAETARNLRPAAGLLDGPPPRPLLFFGGQAFNVDARLRFRTPGTYVGPDAAAAATTILEQVAHAQSVGGSDRRRTSASTSPSVTRRRRRSAAE